MVVYTGNNTGPITPNVNRTAVQVRQNNAPTPAAVPRLFRQYTTKNKSFLDMHRYLKSIGVKNNEFMLTLIDPDLDGIDPHDPTLNTFYKQKILREVLCNYW